MLAIHELEEKELRRIKIACKNLFPPEFATDIAFIASLNSETIKNAYRAKARRYYTDLHRGLVAGNGETPPPNFLTRALRTHYHLMPDITIDELISSW